VGTTWSVNTAGRRQHSVSTRAGGVTPPPRNWQGRQQQGRAQPARAVHKVPRGPQQCGQTRRHCWHAACVLQDACVLPGWRTATASLTHTHPPPLQPRRLYTDGRTKDSKQSFVSWLVAITTLTLYTGVCVCVCGWVKHAQVAASLLQASTPAGPAAAPAQRACSPPPQSWHADCLLVSHAPLRMAHNTPHTTSTKHHVTHDTQAGSTSSSGSPSPHSSAAQHCTCCSRCLARCCCQQSRCSGTRSAGACVRVCVCVCVCMCDVRACARARVRAC
jgi:hypothetical protein